MLLASLHYILPVSPQERQCLLVADALLDLSRPHNSAMVAGPKMSNTKTSIRQEVTERTRFALLCVGGRGSAFWSPLFILA